MYIYVYPIRRQNLNLYQNKEALMKILQNPNEHRREAEIEPVKGILKTKSSVADSPLDNSQRMKLICYILGIKRDPSIVLESAQAYSQPEVVLEDSGITVHIINCELATKYQGGPMKVYYRLNDEHPDVEQENIKMFTGSDRGSIGGIPMHTVNRNNANTSISLDVAKLSGSKIRALCLLNINNNQNIYDMYGNKLTPEEVNMLIITPIRDKIIGGGGAASSSSSRGGRGRGGRGRGGRGFPIEELPPSYNNMIRLLPGGGGGGSGKASAFGGSGSGATFGSKKKRKRKRL